MWLSQDYFGSQWIDSLSLIWIPAWQGQKWPQGRTGRSVTRRSRPKPKCTWNQHLQQWWTPSTSTRNPSQSRGDKQKDKGGRATGRGGAVTRVGTNLTVGPDGCRGQPYMLDGEEPAHKKLWPTVGGKDPQKEFLLAALLKKTWKYQLGIVALCKICWFQKSKELHIQKLPFSWLVHEIALEVGKSDLHFQVHHIVSARSCRDIFGWASGRCQPLCHTCKKGDNYAQRHSVSLAHMWRASSLLKPFFPKSVLVFLLVVGSVGFCQYKGREFSGGFIVYYKDVVKCYRDWFFCK